MAVLEIVTIPDKRLRVVTKPVQVFDDPAFQTLIDDMIETMYAANGVGLAATQVGLDMHLTVIDCSRERNAAMVLINAEILEAGDYQIMDEGCLSVPEHYDKVTRAMWVKAKAQDRHGKSFEINAEGLLAECIQHELDHLKGKLYIDQLSTLKRDRIHDKAIKINKANKRKK